MDHRGGVEPFGKREEKATLYHSGQGSKWKSVGPRRASSLGRMQDPARGHRGAIPPGTFGVVKNLHLVGLGFPQEFVLGLAPWAGWGLLLVRNQVP